MSKSILRLPQQRMPMRVLTTLNLLKVQMGGEKFAKGQAVFLGSLKSQPSADLVIRYRMTKPRYLQFCKHSLLKLTVGLMGKLRRPCAVQSHDNRC